MTTKYVALISGGIDSPVAAHMMLSRGAEMVLLHYDSRPFTDEAGFQKVKTLVARLREIHGPLPAYLVPHSRTAEQTTAHGGPHRLACIVCRRMMYRVASVIARREGATGIVTGESLGQVASQTLQNIAVEQQALDGLPVVRPLIGFDKTEIMEIARRIGTYDLSIQPAEDCSIAPSKPSVASRSVEVEAVEAEIDMDGLVETALQGIIEL